MDFSRQMNTIKNQLYKNGEPIILERNITITGWSKSYDPVAMMDLWTNTNTLATQYTDPAGTPTQYAGYGVKTSFQLSDIDGTQIKKGDVRVVITADFPEPMDDDKFLFDGLYYNYIKHEKIMPGPIVIGYIVQVRQ